jgi:hypothetical protein
MRQVGEIERTPKTRDNRAAADERRVTGVTLDVVPGTVVRTGTWTTLATYSG